MRYIIVLLILSSIVNADLCSQTYASEIIVSSMGKENYAIEFCHHIDGCFIEYPNNITCLNGTKDYTMSLIPMPTNFSSVGWVTNEADNKLFKIMILMILFGFSIVFLRLVINTGISNAKN